MCSKKSYVTIKVNLGQGELGAVSDAVLTLVPSIIMPWIFGNMFKRFLQNGIEDGDDEEAVSEKRELESPGTMDIQTVDDGVVDTVGGTGELRHQADTADSSNNARSTYETDDRPLFDRTRSLDQTHVKELLLRFSRVVSKVLWRILRWQKGIAERLYQMRYNPYWVGIAMHVFNFRVLVPWVFLKLRES
jgi:hypothetical protein